MKHIFIVNPASGNSSIQNRIMEINSICHQMNLDYEIIETQFTNHAKEIAQQYTALDDVCLYAVGGDGTIFEVMNGINDQVPLAIIPCGTGNDFYRVISKSASVSFHDKVIEAIEGRYVKVDYGLSNHTRFLNCTSIGFDAEINHLVNTKWKKTHLPGKLMYYTAAIAKIVMPPVIHAKIQIDDLLIEQDILLCAIMNGQYYGGGFNPTPESSIQDGFYDICIVEPLSRFDIIRLIGLYRKGKHTQIKQCKILRGKHITITTQTPIVMQSDGECFNDSTITLDLIKDGMILKVPQHSSLK